MTIRLRLTVLYPALLAAFFLGFSLLVYFVVRSTLISPVDVALEAAAVQKLSSAELFPTGNISQLISPSEGAILSPTNFFMVAANAEGVVESRSPNLLPSDAMLDSAAVGTVEPRYRTVTLRNTSLRVYTYPLYVQPDGERVLRGYFQIAQSIETIQEDLDFLLLILFGASIAVFFSFFLLGGWTTQEFLKPIQEITAVAVQISRADDLGRRLPDSGQRDEIGRLALALNQTFERLEKLFRAQQRLLADVSHELRTPLTTLRGNVDLMRHMGEYDREALDIMQDELKRMTRLVGDLLLLARADGGSLPVMRHQVELDTILFDVYRQIQPMQAEYGVTVQLRDMTPTRVMGDPDRLKQLLLILLDNAMQYTPQGGEVRLSLLHEGREALMHISDTGPGIPAEHLPHIFERFYRVEKARTRAHGGSGLGLSIAKWIAEIHGGRIKVASLVGQGSTFTIHLPRVE